jgi:hypothetical protein
VPDNPGVAGRIYDWVKDDSAGHSSISCILKEGKKRLNERQTVKTQADELNVPLYYCFSGERLNSNGTQQTQHSTAIF